MENLRHKALSTRWGKSQWCDERDFLPITHATYRTTEGITLILRASIEDVQEALAKSLKPRRSLLTAVRFANGRIEEATENRSEDGTPRIGIVGASGTGGGPAGADLQEYWNDIHPDRAATVATPMVGCPMPEFIEAEVRSSYVLEQFLTPDQIEDYRRFGCFVSLGRDTGRRYMVIHRERPAMLKKYGGRQLFDLDADHALCVHDWEVPPPEEMLALHLCLQIPGREKYIRSLPDTWHH